MESNLYLNPFGQFASMDELRKCHDTRFLHATYRVILGREADQHGIEHYQNLIRTSLSPSDVIIALRNSPEARALLGASTAVIAPGTIAREKRRTLYYYVDHTIICPTNTGVQRVTRRMAGGLQNLGEQVKFIKWDTHTNQFVLITKDELKQLALWQGPVVADTLLADYPCATGPSVGILAADIPQDSWLLVPEVTHITFQPTAMTLDVIVKGKQLGLKTAFVFYDAIPLRRHELKGMAAEHELYMQHLLLADLLVPISKWSAADLVSFFQLHERARLTPTPMIHALALPGESHIVRQAMPVDSKPFCGETILSVGSIVPHKNQLALVRAFDRYCKSQTSTPWKLQLIGNLHPDLSSELIDITRSNPNIEYLGDVSDDELARYYANCIFSVFPSLMEGFGLPILESLSFGKPVICANFGAMAEVASGGGCLTVDTSDETALLAAITKLIDNPNLVAQLSQEATLRPARKWEEYSGEFVQLIDGFSSPRRLLGHIYYWIDHTCTYPANSGIQRVTRGLARSLLEQNIALIPTKWDEDCQCFYPASPEELAHLAKWNGPPVDKWTSWTDPELSSPRDWVLIPELTHYLSKTSVEDIYNYTRRMNIRCAWVFHDAIPWKLRDCYPPEATEAHRLYMLSLNSSQKVFPTNEFTRNDLLQFIREQDIRVGNVEERVTACVLPGEFKGSDRVSEYRKPFKGKITVLCVGTVEPRKNHLGLLAAFLQAKEMSPLPIELIIAGGASFPELASKVHRIIDLTDTIVWKNKVDDSELQQLYRECDFTVFPSIEEGFGLPILESLWNARPCICANFGAMAEVAAGGGCLTVDVRDSSKLAEAILKLASSEDLRSSLGRQATSREFKTWQDYGREIAEVLARERYIDTDPELEASCQNIGELHKTMVNLEERPLLSICISTYNRAGWLGLSLQNLTRLLPIPIKEIEIVVVDNTSTDSTPDVAEMYGHRSDFRYYRNTANVGMLGNLRVTANAARGEYIWILGDDDLVKPGAIETILGAIRRNPGVALVYLNYAYTRIDDANQVINLDQFLAESTPITEATENIGGTIRQLCTKSENFFTAIYCLVFRRDHAIRAYSQNTDGRPFSTMLTCIPTTYHVLNHMMDEPAYWIGEPQLVVNLNVSWMKYAPLWILERIPEVYDTAEKLGADPHLVDRWRVNNMPGVRHFFKEIFENDPEGNHQFVSMTRLVNRLKHLDEFKEIAQELMDIYEKARTEGHPLALEPTNTVFSAFTCQIESINF